MEKPTVVIGASPKKERYSNKAMHMLLDHGHEAYPFHPVEKEIDGQRVYNSLTDLPGAVDTVTIYVRPQILNELLPEIAALRPRRVIFNPGTESPDLQRELEAAGIEVVQACTLVLLTTSQF